MDLASEKHSKKRKGKLDDDQRRIGMESLPPEIAPDVLSRLPITSLLQFRFVSQACHMLSYDPHLAARHFSQATKNNPCLIFHCDYPIRNQLCFVELSDQMDNEIVRRIQTPFCDTMLEFKVIASCNGLLCLSNSFYDDPVYIYNPFTRVYKELPKSRQFDDQELVFGFGFHPVNNEYKIVKITLFQNQRGRPEVQVYTLGSTNWRTTGKVSSRLEWQELEVLVNGRLHWLTPCRSQYSSRSIVSFDLADEQFRGVPRPECGGLNKFFYNLAVLGGCLSAVVRHRYKRFEIWMMKEYNSKESWVKKFNIGYCSSQFLKQELPQPYRIWKIVLNQIIP
ncbi:hypothetical protein ACSBR2_027819 [Camellia fascicularis]